MGHVSGKIADVRFSTDPRRTVFGFERDSHGAYCRKRFSASAAEQRRRRLLNCALWLDNPRIADPTHRNGILSLAVLALSTPVLSRQLAPEAIAAAAVGDPGSFSRLPHFANIARDLPAVAAFAPAFLYRRFFARPRIPGFFVKSGSNTYALHYHAEQEPSAQSRILLGEDRDARGMRRAIVDLRFTDNDVDSIVRTHRLLDEHLRGSRCGELVYRHPDLHAAVLAQARDGFHQIGTTRMSHSPADGVVDRDCRVHGTLNLFVSSSSVFPTSGQANPTLSVIALSIRLAGHLAARRH
jgi:hypothetical protein